jgi:hypothetical protein
MRIRVPRTLRTEIQVLPRRHLQARLQDLQRVAKTIKMERVSQAQAAGVLQGN